MSNFTEETLDRIWQKGYTVDGLDPAAYRTDAANALMKRALYGHEGNLGWEVDHVYPKEKLRDKGVPENRWDDLVNLRPMNAKNNVAKGQDYPNYTVAVQMDDTKLRNKAIEGVQKVVNMTLQNKLMENYKQWLGQHC